jgi:hypothetical protein
MNAVYELLVSCHASLQAPCPALITVTLRLKASRLGLKTFRPPLMIPYFLTSNKGENYPKAAVCPDPHLYKPLPW